MYQLCAEPIESTKDIYIVEFVGLFILPNWYFTKDFESEGFFFTQAMILPLEIVGGEMLSNESSVYCFFSKGQPLICQLSPKACL